MTSPYNLVIVIPTRNRSDLAVNAIRSVLRQRQDPISVVVSDNSTDHEEVCSLQRFCNQLSHPRLLYVRPPEPLPMSEHWEWALGQAMQICPASHYTFLTDRMVFKSDTLSKLLSIIQLYPQAVVSYNHDRVNDYDRPIRLEQAHWTGEIVELTSRQLLTMAAQMKFHVALPRMLNCIVPRFVFDRIYERFGNVFISISPDFCFTFRCLAVLESILYYDRSVLLHYALRRSNGESHAKGIMSKDSVDFLNGLGATPPSFASPVPEFRTVGNSIVHEYCAVRNEVGDSTYPAINFSTYLQFTALEVEQLQHPQLRVDMRALLEFHGWRPSTDTNNGMDHPAYGQRAQVLLRKLRSPRPFLNRARLLISPSLMLTLDRFLGNYSAQQPAIFFQTAEQAMHFTYRYPSKPYTSTEYMSFLLGNGGRVIDSLI